MNRLNKWVLSLRLNMRRLWPRSRRSTGRQFQADTYASSWIRSMRGLDHLSGAAPQETAEPGRESERHWVQWVYSEVFKLLNIGFPKLKGGATVWDGKHISPTNPIFHIIYLQLLGWLLKFLKFGLRPSQRLSYACGYLCFFISWRRLKHTLGNGPNYSIYSFIN